MSQFRTVLFLLLVVFPLGLCGWHLIYRAGASARAISTTTITPVTQWDNRTRGDIRVLSFNIAHGRGLAQSNYGAGTTATREKRMLDLAAIIKGTRADVVVLNEIDFEADWSGGVNQAMFIASHAGYPHVARQRNVDVSLPFYSLKYGNAVLSRFPIVETKLVDYPAFSPMESMFYGKKHGMVVALQTNPTTITDVIAVHLEHRDEATRIRSVRMLHDYCQQSDNPVIVAGDFNSHHPGSLGAPSDANGSNAIAVLEETGYLRNDHLTDLASAPFTFPSDQPIKSLDWVFVCDRLAVCNYEVLETELSDHRPVLATLYPLPKAP